MIKNYKRKINSEKYPKYREIWENLYFEKVSTIIRKFKLEFNKKFNSELYESEFFDEENSFSEKRAIEFLKSLGWRKNPYDKQHWGNWLHSLSPYQGRITPSFAHWLIKIFSKKGDVVLDPFSGIGTIPLESDFLKRKAIGNDLSKYAVLISKAKFDRQPIEEHIKYLQEIKNFDCSDISTDNIDDWIKEYFHEDTLKEIIWLIENFEKNSKTFLLACLMGILHGNRPGYLSVYTGYIIPMKPRSKDHINYRPNKDAKEYRPVLPRLVAKVIRMYKSGIPKETNGIVYNSDARNLPLSDNSVDVIISSPPYYNTLNYVQDNRVRLYFLGLNKKKQEELQNQLIQSSKTYMREMCKVGLELKRVLKPDHYIVYILGDVHRTKYSINTAKDISDIYTKYLGFEEIIIINDEIPNNKIVSRTKKKKLDRVLVLKNSSNKSIKLSEIDKIDFNNMINKYIRE